MKRCTKCGLFKAMDQFYRSKSNKDGRHGSCAKCWGIRREGNRQKEDAPYYERNKEQIAARNRKRCRETRKPASTSVRDAYHSTPQAKARALARQRLYYKNPDNRPRYKAQRAVARALACGTLERPSECGQCGRRVRISAHHEDYTKPLEVIWLCQSCHVLLHADRRRSLTSSTPG